jgi:hypothetical protein
MDEEAVGRAGGKRAVRRHHRERLKRARRFYWGMDLRGDERRIGLLVNTAAICSCWMCCNARRLAGERTVQERRHLQHGLFDDL